MPIVKTCRKPRDRGLVLEREAVFSNSRGLLTMECHITTAAPVSTALDGRGPFQAKPGQLRATWEVCRLFFWCGVHRLPRPVPSVHSPLPTASTLEM